MSHEPLSRSLERLAAGADVRTLNDLVVRTEGRGIFLVIILLCLPFATPVPLPGLSNVIGLVLVVVAVRLFLRRPSRLPNFLGAREWPAPRMAKVIRGSTRLLRALERFVNPVTPHGSPSHGPSGSTRPSSASSPSCSRSPSPR
jgi:hypothetical protein